MGLLDGTDRTPDRERDGDDDTDERERRPEPGGTVASRDGTVRTQIRGATVEVDGDSVTVESPETKQTGEESGNWLTSADAYGIPRGADAVKMRQIAQTAAMQSITNGIADQLLGGDLTFLDNEDVMEDLGDGELEAAARLKTVLRDVFTGPHMGDEDLDDLVVAAVEDMLGPGNAYWQLLGAEGAALPVVSLTTLDPLTIRHNYDEHGFPEDPPYYQASGTFQSGTMTSLGIEDPVPLQAEDIAVMRYPKGNRSYARYPKSAAWQVKEWLELLADETTHVKRFYSDSEVQNGLLQVVDATDQTVKQIRNQIEQASNDPRDLAVVGGEAPANWIDMGGKALNLDVISEQKWFYQLCLGSLGLSKAEVSMVEDVNYSNGEVQAEMVYKRLAGPFGNQFEEAFLHTARQFDAFTELGEPFTPTLAHTDPRAERKRQERLREEYEAGVITLQQYHRRSGDEDLAEDPEQYEVQIDGTTVNYGEHPWPVAKRLLSAAGATDPDAADGAPDDEGEGGEE